MSTPLRIGTRDSELALWQAHQVAQQLQDLGVKTELVPVKSEGDLRLNQPLYSLGITGIFTKTLDLALLNNRIDLAVHSMKDVPTQLPEGLAQNAVMRRANPRDILIAKTDWEAVAHQPLTIATGSLRRQAQWLHRYPHHQVVDLRGNVNLRLQKLADHTDWAAAVFASAGLERIEKMPAQAQALDWMVPAPAQGAMMIVGRADDSWAFEASSALNDPETEACVHIERQFLRTLEGGCTAPIGAYARYDETAEVFHFTGCLHLPDGSAAQYVEGQTPVAEWRKAGYHWAQQLLDQGGRELMQTLRARMQQLQKPPQA